MEESKGLVYIAWTRQKVMEMMPRPWDLRPSTNYNCKSYLDIMNALVLNPLKWYQFILRLAPKELPFRQNTTLNVNDCWILTSYSRISMGCYVVKEYHRHQVPSSKWGIADPRRRGALESLPRELLCHILQYRRAL